MEYIYNYYDFDSLPNPAQCSKCNVMPLNERCKCEGGPSILIWPIKQGDEDYWSMDGSVKPIEIKVSELKRCSH